VWLDKQNKADYEIMDNEYAFQADPLFYLMPRPGRQGATPAGCFWGNTPGHCLLPTIQKTRQERRSARPRFWPALQWAGKPYKFLFSKPDLC